MINKPLWNEAIKKSPKVSSDCMLCIGCLEKRLGRKLNILDFTVCVVNCLDCDEYKSERLINRLQSNK
jgi:hypothetical protein